MAMYGEQISRMRADAEQQVAHIVHEFEATSKIAQAEVEAERKHWKKTVAQLAQLKKEIQSTPEVFRMDSNDEMIATFEKQSVSSGTVAVTPSPTRANSLVDKRDPLVDDPARMSRGAVAATPSSETAGMEPNLGRPPSGTVVVTPLAGSASQALDD